MIELTHIEFAKKFMRDEIEFQVNICDYYQVKEWKLNLREVPDHIFYFNTIGQWEGHVENVPFVSDHDSVFWMPSGKSHQFQKSSKSKERGFINIRAQFYIGKDEVRIQDNFIHINNASEMLPFFQMIYNEFRTKDEWSNIRIRNIFKLLLSSIVRAFDKNQKSGLKLSFKQKSDCLKYIDDHLNNKLDIHDMAKNAGLSQDYFTRVFKKTFGVPPKIWIKEARLRKSQIYILESKLSINEIAHQLGYENPYLFCRQFKEYFGVTTTSFKKNPIFSKMPKPKI